MATFLGARGKTRLIREPNNQSSASLRENSSDKGSIAAAVTHLVGRENAAKTAWKMACKHEAKIERMQTNTCQHLTPSSPADFAMNDSNRVRAMEPNAVLHSLSIASLVAGIAALVMGCFPILSVPLALAAIATGHISAAGETSDRRFALGGLGLGYLSLMIALAAIVQAWLVPQSRSTSKEVNYLVVARDMLAEAETALDQESALPTHARNSSKAQDLAKRFAARMLELQAQSPVLRESNELDSKRLPNTYCILLKPSCAFFIDVSQFRQCTEEQQTAYFSLAWQAAQHSVRGQVDSKSLLVTMRQSRRKYAPIQIGPATEPANILESITYSGNDEEELRGFLLNAALTDGILHQLEDQIQKFDALQDRLNRQ